MDANEAETGLPSHRNVTDPLGRIVDLSRRASDLEQLQCRTRDLGATVYGLAVLNDLREAVQSVCSVQEVLDIVLDRCTSLVGAQEGSIFVFDPASNELVLRAAKGRLSETLCGLRQQLGEGVAGYVAKARQPAAVDDIDADARFTPRPSDRYDSGAFLSVPIVEGEQLLGVINVSGKAGREPFGADDLRKLLLAAGYSAGAIGQRTREELLQRFSRELHERLDGAISRLQDTNRELAHLSDHNDAVVRSIPLGLVAFGRDYRVLFSNSVATGLLGLRDPEDHQAGLLRLDVDQPGRQWAVELAQVVNGGRVVEFEEAILRPLHDERTRTVRVIVSPLRDSDGGIRGGVIVLEDVTEQIRLQRELAASEHHAVIGRLAARVAHELNNPLDGILRFINLALMSKPQNEKVVEYLNDCRRGLERMAGIVSSLLEFSRSTLPVRRDMGINQAINEAVGLMRPRAQAIDVSVRSELGPNLPTVPCGEMVQVFMNLLKNAFDAMPEGGEVLIRSTAKPGAIVVDVSDTGEGMPEHVQKRVFEPFFTTKPPSKGTGLGLAICRDIVEKSHGAISVRSQLGKGTTFTLVIPVP
jgi:PAS domain S-box-containing protein